MNDVSSDQIGLLMETALQSQNKKSVAGNQMFFAGNEWYKSLQGQLELYQFMARSAAHETGKAQRLLDIGNGGVFIYPIDHILEVVAIDLFIEPAVAAANPSVTWLEMSALEMHFERPFDTAIAINTLHHVIGDSVNTTYANLDRIFARAFQALEPGGRLVVIESTVPRWFVVPYKLLFSLLVRLWPLKHPPTFQFHFRDILAAGKTAGFGLREFCFIPKTSDVLTLGFRVKRWMTPIRVGKFVFEKCTSCG